MEPEERAAAGLFLAFQYPVELPGVGNANFLRTALNALRRAKGETELDAMQFLKLARERLRALHMPEDMLKRGVNVGFSGGEKKRNEILQMALLQPRMAVLDETDSGLDIDALRIVADGVNAMRGPAFSALVITHYQRLLNYIVPDRVHVLVGGPHREERRAGAGEGAGGVRLRRRAGGGMTAMQQKGAEGFLHRFEGLRERLPGARLPWAAALRDEAAEAFRASGLPTRRIEAWRYTDLRAVGEAGFDEALTALDDGGDLPAMRGSARAVFLDGRFRPDLSHLDGVGYAVGNLASELRTLEGRIGALARPAEQPLAALNTMLFEDGLVVDGARRRRRRRARPPLRGVADRAPFGLPPAPPHPPGSRRQPHPGRDGDRPEEGRYLHNPVFEIEVGEGATLSHARLQQEGPRAFQLSTVYARVAAGGTYDNFTLNAGGQLVRNEIHAALTGPKGACHMNGAQLLGPGQHADTTTFLDHAAPDCASRQTYKTVLAGKSRGVFQGKILVRQPAQRTDGYQMNQALFLSPDAEIDSKPQLEIYADDVKCSHGATVGELDAEQLFYLRTRGIPDADARAMLVEAFLLEAVEGVSDPAARGALEAAVAGWWDRQVKDAA